jgi:taurine dioxygenase
MNIRPCQGNSIGVNITGFDAKHPESIEQIKDLLYKNKIVIFKDQQLSEQQLCDLSMAFGNAVPYLQSNYHHPQYPLIFVSSNVKKDGQSIGVPRTGGYWHSDTAFMEQPIPLTLLYPQIIPKNSRRTTLFIDLQRAYAAMPQDMQQRLAEAQLIHSGKWKYKVRKEDVGLDISEILGLIHKVQPPVSHPAVITHPVTQEKVLYATRGFTVGIKGWDTDSANAFLEEVFAFVEQPQFIEEFQWQLGDIILWDNRFFAHKAGRLALANDPVGGDINTEEETLVYRIIINDGHPLSAATAV